MAAAHGVPPQWVDAIQGAELWAVQCAVRSAVFLERVYTDCDPVRLGTKQPLSLAGSAKRRFARIWLVIASNLDDQPDIVQWVLAHASSSAVGQRQCSDGRALTELFWTANQLVDALAKHSAEACRHRDSCRRWLVNRESQLCSLRLFWGSLHTVPIHSDPKMGLSSGIHKIAAFRGPSGGLRGNSRSVLALVFC